jgi:hypothetical protein
LVPLASSDCTPLLRTGCGDASGGLLDDEEAVRLGAALA